MIELVRITPTSKDNFPSAFNTIADLGSNTRRFTNATSLLSPWTYFGIPHGILAETGSQFPAGSLPFGALLPFWLYTSSTLLCCLTHESFRNISCIYDGMILNVARIAGWESFELIRGEMGRKSCYILPKGGDDHRSLTERYTVMSSCNIDS